MSAASATKGNDVSIWYYVEEDFSKTTKQKTVEHTNEATITTLYRYTPFHMCLTNRLSAQKKTIYNENKPTQKHEMRRDKLEDKLDGCGLMTLLMRRDVLRLEGDIELIEPMVIKEKQAVIEGGETVVEEREMKRWWLKKERQSTTISTQRDMMTLV